MRYLTVLPVAAAVLLVLSGCAGPVGTDAGDGGPSPDEFPAAAEIDASVFDRHAAAMGSTSFTLTLERTENQREASFVDDPSTGDENVTYTNRTTRYLVEPGTSRYHAEVLAEHDGSIVQNNTYYSNGSTTWVLWPGESRVRQTPRYPLFNESREQYLWAGLFDVEGPSLPLRIAINATYTREGIETYRGVQVMRYEASGADALPAKYDVVANASATLLIDADGIVRHYRVVLDNDPEYRVRQITLAYSLSDVGSTDVDRPDMLSNATAGT